MDFRQARGPTARQCVIPRNRKKPGLVKHTPGFVVQGMGK